jgi:hypothetical protein
MGEVVAFTGQRAKAAPVSAKAPAPPRTASGPQGVTAGLKDWLDEDQWSVSRKGNWWRNIWMGCHVGQSCNVAVFRVGRGWSWRIVLHGIDDGRVWRSAAVWPSVRDARIDTWEVGLAAALKALEEDAERIPF